MREFALDIFLTPFCGNQNTRLERDGRIKNVQDPAVQCKVLAPDDTCIPASVVVIQLFDFASNVHFESILLLS